LHGRQSIKPPANKLYNTNLPERFLPCKTGLLLNFYGIPRLQQEATILAQFHHATHSDNLHIIRRRFGLKAEIKLT
jgi:hypothetical protein